MIAAVSGSWDDAPMRRTSELGNTTTPRPGPSQRSYWEIRCSGMRSGEARNPVCAGIIPTVLVGTKFLAGKGGGSPENVSWIIKVGRSMTRSLATH